MVAPAPLETNAWTAVPARGARAGERHLPGDVAGRDGRIRPLGLQRQQQLAGTQELTRLVHGHAGDGGDLDVGLPVRVKESQQTAPVSDGQRSEHAGGGDQ